MRILLLVLALFTNSLAAQQGRPAGAGASELPLGVRNAMAGAHPTNIRTHVKFLSSDLLEGRGTGQRGGDIAADYIATQFALYGLKPAGDNHGYMQKLPLVGVTTEDKQTDFMLEPAKGSPMPLKFADDY